MQLNLNAVDKSKSSRKLMKMYVIIFTAVIIQIAYGFEPAFKYMNGEYWGQYYTNATVVGGDTMEMRIPHGRGNSCYVIFNVEWKTFEKKIEYS